MPLNELISPIRIGACAAQGAAATSVTAAARVATARRALMGASRGSGRRARDDATGEPALDVQDVRVQGPRLRELRQRHAAEAEERRQVAHDGHGVQLADEIAAGGALPHLDEAAVLERAQRLPHGHAAGAELAHELTLGRELVAVREPSLVNRALDLRDDVLVYAGRPDRSEHRCASLSDQSGPMSRAGAWDNRPCAAVPSCCRLSSRCSRAAHPSHAVRPPSWPTGARNARGSTASFGACAPTSSAASARCAVTASCTTGGCATPRAP